ncbi:hypothetical protein M4D48_14515 [Alkalihalobacillus clausii]|uniref:hypothetical protein n=1 Tax=Shouchella clausii TaxID=79880 RepID=UPI0015C9659B|nr:hypothetical protein [Shouchella clausii]MCM3549789.1 hypothetical protein [Shouchella clausii]
MISITSAINVTGTTNAIATDIMIDMIDMTDMIDTIDMTGTNAIAILSLNTLPVANLSLSF